MTHLDDNALTMLAAGETRGVTAWRQRRHLKTCPACRAQWAETERLWILAQTLRDAAVPASLKHSARAAIHRATAPVSTPVKFPARHRRGMATFGALAAAAALAALFALLPGSPVRPLPAFAQVEDAMAQVRTVRWEETMIEPYAGGGGGSVHVTREIWVRLRPFAQSERVLEISPNMYAGAQWLVTADGVIDHSGAQKTYTLTRADTRGLSRLKGLRRIVNDVLLAPRSTVTHSLDGRPAPPWTSRPDTLRGRRVQRFERIWQGRDTQGIQTLWIDPQTHRLLRRQSGLLTGTGRSVMTEIGDNFRYDETPPPGRFEFRLPSGARVAYEVFPNSPAPQWPVTPPPLPPMRDLEQVVTRAHTAALTGDWPAFESAWDFDYRARFYPERQKWMGQGRQRWKQDVSARHGAPIVWDRPTVEQILRYGTARPDGRIETDPTVLQARVSHRYQQQYKGQPLTDEITYRLHKTTDGWRIFSRGEL